MSDVLAKLYRACDPLVPATVEYYEDCSAVRGGNAFTWQFMQELSNSSTFLHFLFSGHIGSGKSSELEHLRHTLETCPPNATRKRYFPILLQAGEYLDDYDVTPTDILLAIVSEVAATLKEKMGIELKDSYFAKRLDEIKEFFLSDVEMTEGELPISGFKAKLKRLQTAPDARHKVREKLLPQMTSLLSEVNMVFEEARHGLRQAKHGKDDAPYTDIVLILDNLEKLQRLSGRKEGEDSQRELFIEKSHQLIGLDAHVVYTVPLTLVRSHGNQLERIYGTPPFVLPMIKVEQRKTHQPYTPGHLCLTRLLQKRAGVIPLIEIFAQEALDWLITYSGGDIRALMSFIRRACSQTDVTPVHLNIVQRSMSQTIGNISASIPEAHWIKLAHLERNADQHIDNSDSEYRAMLEQLTVMEYLNGDVDDDPFTHFAYWYAVNPIVRQLSQFKAAVLTVDAEIAETAHATGDPTTN